MKIDGPFQVFECVNDNAYKLNLPGEYGVSATFNVSSLSPFLAGDEVDLKANLFEEEGIDRAQVVQVNRRAQVDPIVISMDPITRARAKCLNESL